MSVRSGGAVPELASSRDRDVEFSNADSGSNAAMRIVGVEAVVKRVEARSCSAMVGERES